MSKSEFMKKTLMSFFIVVTLVNVAMAVLGMIYDKGRTFGYNAFFSPIIFGVLGVLPSIVTYSKRELTFKQMAVRKILQLVLLEAVLILFVLINHISETKAIFPFAVSVFVVAVVVQMLLWVLDYNQAKKLNVILDEYQKKQFFEPTERKV